MTCNQCGHNSQGNTLKKHLLNAHGLNQNPKDLVESIEKLRAQDSEIWANISSLEIAKQISGAHLIQATAQKVAESSEIKSQIADLEKTLAAIQRREAQKYQPIEVPLH